MATRLSAWAEPIWRPGPESERLPRRWALGWILPVVLQLAHTAVVAPHYHVGSFDDDGNYLMAAHVLAAGGGLTTVMPSGATVVALYLPGYPAILVPFILALGNGLWVPRAVSTLCVALLYPILWWWLGRRGVRPAYRSAVLVVLAINPVLATFSTMAMAEAPFLLLFLLALLAIDAWEERKGAGWGVVVTVLLAGLVWVKEAGIGLSVGLALYLLWRRRWRDSVGLSLGVAILLLPGVVARLVTGNAAVGDRYAGELSGPLKGGLQHLPSEVVNDVWTYVSAAFRQSILPIGNPLPEHGPIYDVQVAVGTSVPFIVLAGAVIWYRRHPRAESWVVGVYLLETLVYPFVNQRRLILVLPVVVLWYVVGASALGRWALAWLRRALRHRELRRREQKGWASPLRLPPGATASSLAVLAVVVAVLPPIAEFSRDYMFPEGEQTSEWEHAPAVALLKQLGRPSDVVETDFRGSVAFFTGHRTAWTAFTSTQGLNTIGKGGRCTIKRVASRFAADRARFLFIGDIDNPTRVDSHCLLSAVTTPSVARALHAVRLMASSHNHESVFELLRTDTSAGQPALEDPTADRAPVGATVVRLPPDAQADVGGVAYREPATAGRAVFTWSWPRPEEVSQVSVAMASGSQAVGRVTVMLGERASRGTTWRLVASAPGAVGDEGVVPFLLDKPEPHVTANALRVVISTTGVGEVAYANAVGTRALSH